MRIGMMGDVYKPHVRRSLVWIETCAMSQGKRRAFPQKDMLSIGRSP